MLNQLVTSSDLARHRLSSGILRLNILFYENCFSFRPSHSRNTYRRVFFSSDWIEYTRSSKRPPTNTKCFKQQSISSPHVRESRTVLDCGFHAVDSVFQVLDSSICQQNLDSGFQMLWDSGFLEQYSGFHKQNFPGFRIPQAKISQIPETGSVPYMGRVSSKMDNKEIQYSSMTPRLPVVVLQRRTIFFLHACLFVPLFNFSFIFHTKEKFSVKCKISTGR